jgi:ABC-type multidrug transport system fused ATPase/permease subunit
MREPKAILRIVYSLLTIRERLLLAGSLFLVLIGSLFELAGLALVIPVVRAIVEGDFRADYQLPRWVDEMEYGSFVQILLLGLVSIFIIKNLFILFSSLYQNQVSLAINNRIMQRMFETYLRQPYEFHLLNSPAKLVRDIQEYAAGVSSNGIGPVLILSAECLTALGFVSVLMFVNPLSTSILVSTFGVISFFLLRGFRSRSFAWGKQRNKQRRRTLESLLSGFGGIKEIKLFGRDGEIVGEHEQSVRETTRISLLFSFLQGIPRAIFETVTVAGVALIVLLTQATNSGSESTSVIIALFGVAAFRLLPSVNKVVHSFQLLNYGRASIIGAAEALSLHIESSPSEQVIPIEKFQKLEIRNVRYRYPNTESVALSVSHLEIVAGESIGVMGTSGGGKSTLVDLMIGVLTPSEGQISVNGFDISLVKRSWQNKIGYVPQTVYLMDTSIRRNVAFGLPDDVISEREVIRALKAASLLEFVTQLPDGLDTLVGERGVRLSGGQRQRLGIARALYGSPEVLVFDEATSALDDVTEANIAESLRELSVDRTLVIIAHRLSTLRFCSRIIRVESGRLDFTQV